MKKNTKKTYFCKRQYIYIYVCFFRDINRKNIQKYRELKGISQRELANKVALFGVTLYNSDISRIENNTLFIRDYEQYAICKVLGISIEQLFEDCNNFFN